MNDMMYNTLVQCIPMLYVVLFKLIDMLKKTQIKKGSHWVEIV